MKKQTKILQFKVIIETDEDGMFVASVPELPGCYTQGKTLEQVRERIKEVIELVSVPIHSGESVGVGLLRKILRDANLTPDQFNKLR